MGGAGGGGLGIFEPQEEFFSLSNSLNEIFLDRSMNIFWGQLACMNIFHLIFPCANIFLYFAPHPHKYSNGPSLAYSDPE